MNNWRVWFWLIPLALLWPAIHLLVALIRFGGSSLASIGVAFFLNFLPMSLFSGALLLLMWIFATKKSQRICLIMGYLLASPITFAGSLLSGLAYQPLVGTLLWGAGPLAIGVLIGSLVGYFLSKLAPDKA